MLSVLLFWSLVHYFLFNYLPKSVVIRHCIVRRLAGGGVTPHDAWYLQLPSLYCTVLYCTVLYCEPPALILALHHHHGTSYFDTTNTSPFYGETNGEYEYDLFIFTTIDMDSCISSCSSCMSISEYLSGRCHVTCQCAADCLHSALTALTALLQTWDGKMAGWGGPWEGFTSVQALCLLSISVCSHHSGLISSSHGY